MPGPEDLNLTVTARLAGFLDRYSGDHAAQAVQDLEQLSLLMELAQADTAGRFRTAEALFACEALFEAACADPPTQRLDQFLRESLTAAMSQGKLVEKWNLDARRLTLKLETLSMAQALALWHWVRLFWLNPDWDHAKVAKLFRTKD